MRDEIRREPIEKFRVRGRRAVVAKIVGRVHQARAEMVLPNAIDDHARGKRIFRAHNPLRQRHAPRRFRGLGGKARAVEFQQRARCHRLARLHGIAAVQPKGLRWFRKFARVGQQTALAFGQFLPQRRVLF